MPGRRVVEVAVDFLLHFGSLRPLQGEGSVHQAELLHRQLQGSGYGRPLYRFGKPSADRKEFLRDLEFSGV